MEPWPSRRERIGNGHPPKARLRTGVAVGRLSRPYRSPLAAWALKEAGQARRVGKGAAAEHRAQDVVRARAEPLPRVSQALHQRAAPQAFAADRAQATSEGGDAHPRLLRPRHRTQRRRRPRRGVAPRTADLRNSAASTTEGQDLRRTGPATGVT